MNSTTIAHLRCQYLIPQEHPTPEDIRSCLDSVARNYLSDVCSVLLTRLLDSEDRSLWFIRRLDVEVGLHVGSQDMQLLAEQWGSQIVKGIIRALTLLDEEASGHDALVKHFPHQNAYVAQFISDLATGCAWERWYYRSFDALRSLSTSAAIRTALSREPEQTAAIFAQLVAQHQLEPVLHCLSEGDACTIYEFCLSASYDGNIDESAYDRRADMFSSRANMQHSSSPNVPGRGLMYHTLAHGLVSDEGVIHQTPTRLSTNVAKETREDDEVVLRERKTDERAEMSTFRVDMLPMSAEAKSISDENTPINVDAPVLRANMLPMSAEAKSIHDEDVSIHVDLAFTDAEKSPLLSPQLSLNVPEMPRRMKELPLDEEGQGMYRVTVSGRRHIVELLLAAWSKAALQLASEKVATAQNALRLYTTLWQQVMGYAVSSVREAIEHVLRFTEIMRSIAEPGLLVSFMLRDDLTAIVELLRTERLLSYLENLSYLQQVAAGDTVFVRRLVSTVAPSTLLTRQHAMTRGAEERITTLLGGLFLLLPSFIELKLHTLLKGALTVERLPEQKMAWVRYVILLKCFGLLYQQWPEIVRDPMLALVSGCDETPFDEMLPQLNALLTSDMLWEWQRLLIGQVARYRSIEGQYLYAELLAIEERRVLLIRDMRYDAWLFIASVAHEIEAWQTTLVRGLHMIQDETGVQIEYLILGTGLGQLSAIEMLDQQLHVLWTAQDVLGKRTALQTDGEGEDGLGLWSTDADSIVCDVQIELLHAVRRLRDAGKDMRYLHLYRRKQAVFERCEVELSLSLLAHTVMGSFARRLIGFDRSSAEYLYQNFLAGTSTVGMQADMLEVRLARCPLHLVLRIAGMHEQSYSIPWCDNMQVHVALAKA